MVQKGYEPQWGPAGRDDLASIKKLGANAVRLYHSFGLETESDHGSFLDHAEKNELFVMPGFHTQMNCPKFDCYDAWKAAAKAGFAKGFLKDGAWHPAVKMIILQHEPDALNFGGATIDDCSKVGAPGAEARCRLKAALSALDGFLAAEKEAGIVNSTVNLTISWSSAARDSVDDHLKGEVGIWGFHDMRIGVQDPNHAYYKPRSSLAELQEAWQTRWTNSMTSSSDWDFINEKVAANYHSFLPTPWFLSEYRGVDGDIQQDLETMDSEAKKGGAFIGVSMYQFQTDYTANSTADGIFGLGKLSIGPGSNENTCEEDVSTGLKVCQDWTVMCLQKEARAAAVVGAWKGTTDGKGRCQADLVV